MICTSPRQHVSLNQTWFWICYYLLEQTQFCEFYLLSKQAWNSEFTFLSKKWAWTKLGFRSLFVGFSNLVSGLYPEFKTSLEQWTCFIIINLSLLWVCIWSRSPSLVFCFNLSLIQVHFNGFETSTRDNVWIKLTIVSQNQASGLRRRQQASLRMRVSCAGVPQLPPPTPKIPRSFLLSSSPFWSLRFSVQLSSWHFA